MGITLPIWMKAISNCYAYQTAFLPGNSKKIYHQKTRGSVDFPTDIEFV